MSIVTLDFKVESYETIAVLYDVIQIWRSPNEGGSPIPYAEIAALEESRAYVDGSVEGPWALNGTTLIVALNGGPPVSVPFSGSVDLALSRVLEILESALPGIASEVPTNTNRIRISSSKYGTASSVTLSGTAATVLGLSTSKTNGKGAYPFLSQTTEVYSFVDYDGSNNFFYKARFYNTVTGAASNYSIVKQGAVEDPLPNSLLTGFVYLADGAGNPIVGRRIILVPTKQILITNPNNHVFGVLSSVDRITMTTDEGGYAESSLVKGQTFKMFIEGTTFHREITIPNSGTELNLLVAASVANDPLTIVETPPMLIRVN